MKYCQGKYEIDQAYEASLNDRLVTFIKGTGIKKSILLTFVTTEGVKRNTHSGGVQCEVVLDELFKE